jgi:hypothetical protein
MFMFLTIPIYPLRPFYIEVLYRFEVVLLEKILLDEPIKALFLALRFGVPHAGEDTVNAETVENTFELGQSRAEIGFELRASVCDYMFRKPVRFKTLFENLQHAVCGLVREPATTCKITAVVIDKRMEVNKADSLDDYTVHDVYLPGIVRFRVFEVLVWFKGLLFPPVLSVFGENTPYSLAMELQTLFPEKIPYLPTASGSVFSFDL